MESTVEVIIRERPSRLIAPRYGRRQEASPRQSFVALLFFRFGLLRAQLPNHLDAGIPSCLLAAVILEIPTFLMGGILPAAARAVVRPDDISRRSLRLLYGLNKIGAVMGALAGTFYLFENFGNRLTLWWAALRKTFGRRVFESRGASAVVLVH